MLNPFVPKTKILSSAHLIELYEKFLRLLDGSGENYGHVAWWWHVNIETVGSYRFKLTLRLGKMLPNIELIIDHGYVVALSLPEIRGTYDWKFQWPFESFTLSESEVSKLRLKTVKYLRHHRADKFKIVGEGKLSVQYATTRGKYKGFFLDKFACKFSKRLPSYI